MKIKCVVAAINTNGKPDFFFCIVEATQEEYDNAWHYEAAGELANENGYENLGIVFDEYDGPAWLFEHFAWDSATIVSASAS